MRNTIFGIYIIIAIVSGLCFKFFGSYSYKSLAYNMGQGIVWPFTAFADDPEIDGSTRENFGLSYQKVIVAHKKSEGQARLISGMNMLALLAYAELTPTFNKNEYDKLYKGPGQSFEVAAEIMKRPDVLDALRKKTDGMDFSAIISASNKAPTELQELLASRPSISIEDKNVTGIDNTSAPDSKMVASPLEPQSAATSNIGQCIYPKTTQAEDGKLMAAHAIYIYKEPNDLGEKSLLEGLAAFNIGAETSKGFVQLIATPGWGEPQNPDAGKVVGWAKLDEFEFQALRNCN